MSGFVFFLEIMVLADEVSSQATSTRGIQQLLGSPAGQDPTLDDLLGFVMYVDYSSHGLRPLCLKIRNFSIGLGIVFAKSSHTKAPKKLALNMRRSTCDERVCLWN